MLNKKIWDVVVIGGGVSGCMAAFAAARQGARALIVERYGFLGGALTNAGVGPMMTFHAGERQVVTGLPEELIDRLCEKGACIGHIEDTTSYTYTVTPFDAEALKLLEILLNYTLLTMTFSIPALITSLLHIEHEVVPEYISPVLGLIHARYSTEPKVSSRDALIMAFASA